MSLAIRNARETARCRWIWIFVSISSVGCFLSNEGLARYERHWKSLFHRALPLPSLVVLARSLLRACPPCYPPSRPATDILQGNPSAGLVVPFKT